MKIYIPRYDFSLRKIVADEVTLAGCIHHLKVDNNATLYADSDAVELLKACFYSETGYELVFDKITNDNSLPDSNLNKYCVSVKILKLATLIPDLV